MKRNTTPRKKKKKVVNFTKQLDREQHQKLREYINNSEGCDMFHTKIQISNNYEKEHLDGLIFLL